MADTSGENEFPSLKRMRNVDIQELLIVKRRKLPDDDGSWMLTWKSVLGMSNWEKISDLRHTGESLCLSGNTLVPPHRKWLGKARSGYFCFDCRNH